MRLGPLLLGVLATAIGAGRGDAERPRTIRIEHDDTEITEDVIVERGTYDVADTNGNGVLIVRKDGVTVDLGESVLRGADPACDPDAFTGIGISVVGARGVRVLRGHVQGFKVGLHAEDAPDLELRAFDGSGNFRQRLRSTPQQEDPADWLWPHENDQGEWESRYGAGISLTRCPRATVAGSTVRDGQNGLLLTRCDECAVLDDDFSFNSGWGVALWRSNRCEVSHCSMDWCVRGYSHGVYARGQDSAGILVFEQCSDNRFVGNSATHSGDGFFLYAGHETTRRTGTGGCNRNLVAENDFAYAVANGIEATFSEDNDFVRNDCYGSDYGVWAGYSRRSKVRWNLLQGCLTAGVAIEHGQENEILWNLVTSAGDGIHLWWDEDKDLLAGPFCQGRDCTSSRNLVAHNSVRAERVGIRLDGDTGSRIEVNRVRDASGTTGDRYVLTEDPPPAFATRGTRRTRLSDDLSTGREQIRIDEWGPVDPRRTVLFPRRTDAPQGEAVLNLLGSKPFRVVESSAEVEVSPTEGTAPVALRVRARPDGASSIVPFRVAVEVDGERQQAEGSLLVARWDVRWFRWSADPREDQAAYDRLVAGEPVVGMTSPAVDFPWQGGGPAPDLTDHFATVATTTLRLPAGRYAFRTVSDDGVRLTVDGRRVIDDWTWHAPKEDVAEVDLAAGEHTVRLDHFEIDGWAALSFRIEKRLARR